MKDGLDQQYRAVASGHWPLLRYDPVVRATGRNPFFLDSPKPRMSLADYRKGELRYTSSRQCRPCRSGALVEPRPADRPAAMGGLRRDGEPRCQRLRRETRR